MTEIHMERNEKLFTPGPVNISDPVKYMMPIIRKVNLQAKVMADIKLLQGYIWRHVRLS